MTPAGVRAYEENKHTSGRLLLRECAKGADGRRAEALPRRTRRRGWTGRSARQAIARSVLHWITSAKRPETRAKRLATLIEVSAKGEKIPGYDWTKK